MRDKCRVVLVGNLRGKRPVRNINVDMRIILKWILEK
jgi:hypothetical protein